MLHVKFQDHRTSDSGEDFLKIFTIYGRGGHLGHVTWTIYICSCDVWNNHKAVQCDKCEMWVPLISSMKPCKIQAVPGFVQNVNFSTSQTHSFLSN